jgi:hypothetical protein
VPWLPSHREAALARRRRRRPPETPAPFGAWDELHPTLDLHGETAESARRRAEPWLRSRQAEGVRTVRLITGRGLHSVGPPVLRGEIEEMLGALRGTLVSRFSLEHGRGAFRVELVRAGSRRAPDPAPPRPAPRRHDPELRHRAEEALWELGVDPTPSLIEAEVRRILEEEADETS